jgi:hypothetical protein
MERVLIPWRQNERETVSKGEWMRIARELIRKRRKNKKAVGMVLLLKVR